MWRCMAFQSRAGFSECLDFCVRVQSSLIMSWFQSRAGFSECLDVILDSDRGDEIPFQSRAGFSECLDHSLGICLPV